MRENTFKIYWSSGNNRIDAGVAFYDEKSGSYALRINLFPTSRTWGFKLKPVLYSSNRIKYSLTRNAHRDDGTVRETRVGVGTQELDSEDLIQIDFGPFTKKLILKL